MVSIQDLVESRTLYHWDLLTFVYNSYKLQARIEWDGILQCHIRCKGDDGDDLAFTSVKRWIGTMVGSNCPPYVDF